MFLNRPGPILLKIDKQVEQAGRGGIEVRRQ
jgi:hypothetical protein